MGTTNCREFPDRPFLKRVRAAGMRHVDPSYAVNGSHKVKTIPDAISRTVGK
jgi:hypothetical protein